MFAKGAVCHQPLTEMERSRLLWLQFVAATIWLTLFIVDCSWKWRNGIALWIFM